MATMSRIPEMYKPLMDESIRVFIEQGGTSSAKTYTILQRLADIAAGSKSPIVITVVGQDLPNLKVGAWRDMKNIISSDEVLEGHCDIKEYDHSVVFSNGSIIEFKSYENEQDAKSGKRDYLFINEANGISYDIYWQLAIRTKYQIFIDYNPTSRFWVHDKVKGTKGSRYIQSDHRSNPYLTKEQHERIEGIEDEELWKVYARGETGRITGLVFSNWDIIDNDMLPPLNECKMRCYGMDFGFTNDPTALEEVRLAHGELWIDELIYSAGLTNPDIARKAKEEGVTGATQIIADCAEPKSIQEIKNKGLWVIASSKGADSIKNGIDILKRYKIHITRRSLGLIDNMQKYKWKIDKDGKTTNVPIDAFNHGIDAIRYVALAKLFTHTTHKTKAHYQRRSVN